MIKTTLNWTVKNLKNMYDGKETLSFDHPIQRQSAQWTNLQQSLLVHSILGNYPVPAIYVEKSDSADLDEKGKPVFKYSVLDGKQRMTTIFSFINCEYTLSEDTPTVDIEGETYELAGRNFEDLDVDVQQELLRFKFQIFAFEDATDDEIEEIFFRLNNSTPLTKPQKSKPLMGVENAKFIDSILKGSFFKNKCNFSQLQLRKSDDMCTLLQAMMLMDNKYYDYEYKSISADEVMKYSAFIKGNYTYDQQILMTTAINYLDEAFDSKEKQLKKINIPMVILMADIALTRGIKPDDFHDWFLYFFVSCKTYSQYCSSGSIKSEKVLGRIETMQSHFWKHFKLDEAPTENSLNETVTQNQSTLESPFDNDSSSYEETDLQADIDKDKVSENDSDINSPIKAFKDTLLEEDSLEQGAEIDTEITESENLALVI